MHRSSTTPALRSLGQDLIRRQRIAQAVAIAECGHPCKALAIVLAVPASTRHFEDWDLIARLLIRMSRFHEARDAWEQAAHAGMSPERVRNAITALDARRHITLIALVLIAGAVPIAFFFTLLGLMAVFS